METKQFTTPPPAPPTLRKQRSFRALKIIGSWVAALGIALLLQRYGFQSYQVFGQSMEPTLSEGDYLIISKVGASLANLRRSTYIPERGQIVVINSPIDSNRLIKRVIGLPGERINISGGRVKIFNNMRREGFDPYQELGIESRYTSGQLSMVVPDGHVFLVGDNREAGGSLDSRNDLGAVPSDNIVGRLILRLWPFSKTDTF